jgi:transcriptional regulator with XRE-family HTH domain
MLGLEQKMCEKFQVLRRERGWSQLDVSEKLAEWGIDMHQTTVAKMEKGKRPLRVAEMFALAHVFGMPPAAVFFMPAVDDLVVGMDYMTDRLKNIEEEIASVRESAVKVLDGYLDVYANATAERSALVRAMRHAHESLPAPTPEGPVAPDQDDEARLLIQQLAHAAKEAKKESARLQKQDDDGLTRAEARDGINPEA